MKRLWMRALLGFPLGVCAGYLLMILYSLILTPYQYTPLLPIFESMVENSLAAIVLQTLLCGCLGCFTTSFVTLFEKETWSNGKAILCHSLATCLMLMGSGFVLCVTSLSIQSLIVWVIMLFLLLLIIYTYMYHHVKKDIAYLNRQLSDFLKEEPYGEQ